MTQYLVSVWHEGEYELDFSSDDAQRRIGQVMEFNTALEAAGALVLAGGLEPASTSVVVRPEADGLVESDGPYVSSGEQMGGFWIIDVDSADTAGGWARRAAEACEQPVELRPLQG